MRPGLSAFATTPEVAAAQVRATLAQSPSWTALAQSHSVAAVQVSGLVRVAASIVPAAAQAATPVYLYATAGLRLLPASQAQALLDTVGRFLTGQAAAPAEEWRCPFAFGEARASSEVVRNTGPASSRLGPCLEPSMSGTPHLGGGGGGLRLDLGQPLTARARRRQPCRRGAAA